MLINEYGYDEKGGVAVYAQHRWRNIFFDNEERLAFYKENDAVEIGCLDGVGTLYLSNFFKSVYAIDPWDGRQQGTENKYQTFVRNASRAKEGNVYHCRTGSETPQALEFLQKSNPKLSFAFIDGLHTYEAVMNDFNLIRPWCIKGCYIVIDDTDVAVIDKACDMISQQVKEVSGLLPNIYDGIRVFEIGD